ncbi:XrtA-associated ATPase [Parasalinivibrio latis]|uniref:XrtA/PEP-CTERM system-associated ATPase n=1 Tax=Parasalinivibrio latis TaxID=2952610 RepID=UPI0030E19884
MYESHFGFTSKPFRLSPDPRFFFASPHHDKAISYLNYGLSLGEGFIVVTGPIGTGKTILARNLLSSVDESIVATQIATTRLNPEELVRMVCANFSIDAKGMNKAEALKALESFLIELNRQGKRALLLVDEAQNLPAESVEELRMLSNFQSGDKPLLQSFLLGQEELKKIIELPQMEQFRQRIIASCHLQPFSAEETQQYIEHRLRQSGWDGHKPDLKEDIFPAIRRCTQGIPRRINIFADRLFLYACIEDKKEIGETDVEAVIAEMNSELSGFKNKIPEDVKTQTGNNGHHPAHADLGFPTHDQTMAELDAVALYSRAIDDKQTDWDTLRGAKMHKTLSAISSILDDVIQRKVNTVRHLDKMISEKKLELAEKEKKRKSVMKTWFKK